jgi:signal transduction histidine kinase
MKRYQNRAGLIIAGSIPLFILPARISEGQWKDPINLIGSEIVIFLMSLACWHTIIYLQNHNNLKGWHKVGLSLLCCCLLSNLFFFTFNPFFKDFPFRTATNPLYVRILMLSSRGILMSIILIPGAYYVHKDLEARKAQHEHQKLALQKFEIENKLLESEVFERTKALHYALISMQRTQDELEHQIYIQARLLASFNHDVRAPFKFSVLIAGKIARLAALEGDQSPIYKYASELNSTLKNTLNYVKNLLEFTKLPLRQKFEKSETINLIGLIEEKAQLFEGSIKIKKNMLLIHVDQLIQVESNYNLLGIVIHNLIDNANKYTSDGSIDIIASTINTTTELSISNKGETVPNNIINWINDDIKELNTSDTINQNKMYGIGLLLVKEISSMLGIKLHLDSDILGTKVTLAFKNPVSH